VVAPSRTARGGWVEAQGLGIIEAMMAGRPVVATRTGGIIDSIEHEVSGLLVPEQAPAQLAAAIGRLIDDPILAQMLGKRAQQTALAKFSRASSAAKFSELFADLLSTRQTSRSRGGQCPRH